MGSNRERKIKIRVIIPNQGMDRQTLVAREEMLAAAVSGEVEISAVCIANGPESIEANSDEALAASEVIRECIRAEQEGCQAAVIYCFSDLGLEAARENVRIPVIGPGAVSLAAADMLTERFCVVTTMSNNIPRTYRRLMKNQVAKEKMTSVQALDIPVLELREDPQKLQQRLQQLAADAIAQEHIDGLILGCLGMAQYGEALEAEYGITVLDPAFLAVGYAELAARLGLQHSQRAYPAYARRSELLGKGGLV